MTSLLEIKKLPTQFKCPFCNKQYDTTITKINYSNKTILCPNKDCLVSWIPRSASIRNQVIEYLPKLPIITCANSKCNHEYYNYCVPHNKSFSECPVCNFKNPHCDTTRDIVKYYHDYEHNESQLYPFIKMCQYTETIKGTQIKCNKLYDGTWLPTKKDTTEYEYYCINCIIKRQRDYDKWLGICAMFNSGLYDIPNYFDINGTPFSKPSISDYPCSGHKKDSDIRNFIDITSEYLPSVSE